MSAVDEALKGPDFFLCEKYKATMLKRRCIERQAMKQVDAMMHVAGVPDDVHSGCWECPQGAKIKRSYSKTIKEDKPIVIPAKAGIQKLREGKEMAMRGDCGNCPRKNVPLSSCKPPLCWRCQQAAEGLKGEERVKALAAIREETEKIISGELPPVSHGRKKTKIRPKEKRMKALNDRAGSEIKTFRFSPKDGAGIVHKLLENYEVKMDEAEEIISLLIGLRKYGVECEMPKRHIVE
jgi:hypothetical protein